MGTNHNIPYHARKLATAAEMRRFDRLATERYGIPGIILMENAGRHVFDVVCSMMGSLEGGRITIISGKGNNGGDGFVAARRLRDAGASVCVFMLGDSDDVTGDARVNLDILSNTGLTVSRINSPDELAFGLAHCDIVVDAILGTGLKGEVHGLAADVIAAINSSRRPVVAVDIPSGMDADTGRVLGVCVKADCTATFALGKVGLFMYPGTAFAGRVFVGDIGIPHALYDQIAAEVIVPQWVSDRLPRRSRDAHKGAFGTTAVIAGSRGMSGAAALASEAVLRVGAGLSILCVPSGLQNAMMIKLTEVMTRGLPETSDGTVSSDALEDTLSICKQAASTVIGCGLGVNDDTCEFVYGIVGSSASPIVIDADGLNCLSRNVKVFEGPHGDIVITPHPAEMARLLGTVTAEIQSDRMGAAKTAASKFSCVTVLKGAGTIIAHPDGRVFVNTTGNPGMATGGTGDVLAGVIGGLISQGMNSFDAAVCGVYIHGLAGDIAAERIGEAGMLAGDLLHALPEAIKRSLVAAAAVRSSL